MLAVVVAGELIIGGAACRMEPFTPGLHSFFLAHWFHLSLQHGCVINSIFLALLEAYPAVNKYHILPDESTAFRAILKRLLVHIHKSLLSPYIVISRCYGASIPVIKVAILRYRTQLQT